MPVRTSEPKTKARPIQDRLTMTSSRTLSTEGGASKQSGEGTNAPKSQDIGSPFHHLERKNPAINSESDIALDPHLYQEGFGPRTTTSSSVVPPFTRSPEPGSSLSWDPASRSLRYENATNSQKKPNFGEPHALGLSSTGRERSSAFSFPRSHQPLLSAENSNTHHDGTRPISRSMQGLICAQVDDYLDSSSSHLGRLVQSEILKSMSSGVLQHQIDAAFRRRESSNLNQAISGFGKCKYNVLYDVPEPFSGHANMLSYNHRPTFGGLTNDSHVGAAKLGTNATGVSLDDSDFLKSAFAKYDVHSHSRDAALPRPWTLRSQIGSYPSLPKHDVPRTGIEFVPGQHSMYWVWANIEKNGWLTSPLPCSTLPDEDVKVALRTRMDEYQRRVSALPNCQFTIIENLVLDLQDHLHNLRESYKVACAGEDYKIEICRKEVQECKRAGTMNWNQGIESMRVIREVVADNKVTLLEKCNKNIMKVIEESIEKQVEVFVRNEKPAEVNSPVQDDGHESEISSAVQPCNGGGGSEITVEVVPACKGSKTKPAPKCRATKVAKKSPAKTRVTRANKCG